MRNFIAFDFETANRRRHSICSVGMVFVEDGKIVDSIYQLIDPEEEFDRFNISIHGIAPEDVIGAPTFDVFYSSIKEKIENKLMVAHNLSFDGYALRDNLARYEVEPSYNQLLCTYQLSRKIVPGLPTYQLNSLCRYFGVNLVNHHHALDDAEACAHLMLKLIDEYNLTDFEELYLKTSIKPGEIAAESFRSSLVSKSNNKRRFSKSIDLREIVIAKDADPSHQFFGKNIVFTGKLKLFSRKEAAELVAARGGIPQNNVTQSTNYIILGDFEEVMIKGNKSSKLKKAENMVLEGNEIEIISEVDFMKMI
ncbi:exonuclease domain-containing protein [Bacillaceae bacterium CLA-AA-H227]|uniref:Exonuclease domain-containing protein n=1 Tax=Robertmurraya yapensis (ex Hitch et al 2024) TaxID=3133160 RepID=A0ACC6SDI0_9BACI